MSKNLFFLFFSQLGACIMIAQLTRDYMHTQIYNWETAFLKVKAHKNLVFQTHIRLHKILDFQSINLQARNHYKIFQTLFANWTGSRSALVKIILVEQRLICCIFSHLGWNLKSLQPRILLFQHLSQELHCQQKKTKKIEDNGSLCLLENKLNNQLVPIYSHRIHRGGNTLPHPINIS